VLVVDGWDSLAVVSGELDGGRTAADLLGLAQAVRAAGGMVVLTATRPLGGLTALADERFLLTAPDAADYLAAGLPRDGVPVAAVPGRAVRAGDGAEIQFALPDPAAARGGLPDDRIGYRAPVLVRKLPSRVPPPPHRGPAARWLLGVVGDRATELYVEPTALGLQMLVIGPPRSGLTSVLAGMLDQCGPGIALVAAGRRSWLPAAAAARGADAVLAALPCAGQSAMTDAPEDAVLLVDDAEVLDDTPLGAAVTDWLREGRPAVLAAHTDAVGAAFRGPLAALRRAGCGALLRPGPADGELLGVPTRGAVRIPRRPGPPGRGLLVPGSSRLPVPDIVSAQLVTSDPVVTPGHAPITACGDTCGPMAERRSP
jgi:S-DNA-T family DNA segregation ATPase FtsK/SpoIIIE